MGKLWVEPLERALAQLERGLAQAAEQPGDELLRDGVIQRFEYSMDLCWKLLQRFLKDIAQIDEGTLRTKRDLFREAARLRLIHDASAWIGHWEARNQTLHTYNRETAQAVFLRTSAFAVDARFLLRELASVES